MLQMKEKDKASEKPPRETEISNLPEKDFKAEVIAVLVDSREEWTGSVRTSPERQQI